MTRKKFIKLVELIGRGKRVEVVVSVLTCRICGLCVVNENVVSGAPNDNFWKISVWKTI